ncbi:MAG: PadR family transcriptional regulator [Chloroflexi bacterium]|nr:PadR family transcriptional regulator [Chloroflexota bacterium]
MSLTYAILSIVDLFPMTGYELKHQVFDRSANYFWPADASQIYRTLRKLDADGLVRMELDDSSKPHRKVYHITPAGRDHLDEWMRLHEAPPVLRDPFLIRLFFAWHVSNSELIDLLQAQRADHVDRLASYRAIQIGRPKESDEGRWDKLQQLTLDFGIAIEELYLEWLDRCRNVIADLPDASAERQSPFAHLDGLPPDESSPID